ncbi:MAG: hypothetical protein EZS28_013601 [Streblomastix strix]|uniref:SH3 domain-containing protein n=1 Tax=Streblomastix strix TaxID=222440 RepID=A0A5J4W948_9EUKA|nr:MAG: hypothetical protein EZS28_013601 [Streblomastix strix]
MSTTDQYFEVIVNYGGVEGDANYIAVKKGDVVRLIKKSKEWITIEKDGHIGKVPKRILEETSQIRVLVFAYQILVIQAFDIMQLNIHVFHHASNQGASYLNEYLDHIDTAELLYGLDDIEPLDDLDLFESDEPPDASDSRDVLDSPDFIVLFI